MSAERGLAKIMADEDCREWLYELLIEADLFDREYSENEVYNAGRAAVAWFASTKIVKDAREHHHEEFLEMQREGRRRLESDRIEAEKQRKAEEKLGRQPRTP